MHIRERARNKDDLILCKKGKFEFYDSQELINKDKAKDIRNRRGCECFKIVDRPLWLESLTEEQRMIVKQWYQAWLDAPETLVVPEKPEFIK